MFPDLALQFVKFVIALRERTLVLLAASTGLRQSELFALKWDDIDFAHGTMNITGQLPMVWWVNADRGVTEAGAGPSHPG